MHQSHKNYHQGLKDALNNEFLRKTMDAFAVSYRSGRANAFQNIDERALIAEVAHAKDWTIQHMDELYHDFKAKAEARGVTVHLAHTAQEANAIIARIAKDNGCKKAIKSKSMTAEEIHLNQALELEGMEVVETDLGEWIIQMRKEGPSHMVMPAIHLSRQQVAELFSDVTGEKQGVDIDKLVKVARHALRYHFATADMGITGANFAIADSGTIGLVTNEGNARLVSTLPRVHVALCGLDKLVPNVHEALTILNVLPRNATGQALTSYITWIGGANECNTIGNEVRSVNQMGFASEASSVKSKEMHIVFLDNGRRALAKDPIFSQVLRCVRCGACANVCPVYRLVGGHKMGHVYIGAIGLILTYFFHDKEHARNLVQNCIGCEACKHVCAGGIDLPRLIREIRARFAEDESTAMGTSFTTSSLMAKVLKNRKLFHTLLRFGSWAQRPLTKGTPYMRHLPHIFADHGFKALPAIAPKSFRDMWEERSRSNSSHTLTTPNPKPPMRIALFAGCAQDFIYPEQLMAALALFKKQNIVVDFPMNQSCCGLPLEMMGEREASRDLARQNILAFGGNGDNHYDHIVTLCASCASHLKHGYNLLFTNQTQSKTASHFSNRVIDFSSFVHDILGMTAQDFHVDTPSSPINVAYHSSCHLCRGLGIVDQPRALIKTSGANYIPSPEEDVCCGFGGSYSVKFPELSATLLQKKLQNIEASTADMLVADCPGCIMQIRGGMEKYSRKVKVIHMAELLAERLKEDEI